MSSRCSPALPVSVTSAEGLAMSAFPLAESLMSFTVRPAAVRLALSAETEKSGAQRGPLAVSAKLIPPASGVPASVDSAETSPSVPLTLAWISEPCALAVPLALSEPEVSSSSLAANAPSGSRVAVAENSTRSPSSELICGGSAFDTASAFIFSVIDRSASETPAVSAALSASNSPAGRPP